MSQGTATTLAGSTPPITEKRKKKNLLSDGQGTLAAILISPTMLVILFVVGIPILLSLRESVYRKATTVDPNTGMIPEGESFVGLANFTEIFTNPQTVQGAWGSLDRLLNSFWNVTFFTIVCVVLETILGVAMALIMARAFRGKGMVRAAILIPWAIPTIVSAKMWGLIFDSNGVMNVILDQKILWLADNVYSQWAVVIADVWKTAPFIGLLTLAGLQTIPGDVYEAAKVDGANAWQTFVRITLPMVKPALVVAVLFRTLDTMRMFDLPWGMIGAGKYYVETMSMFAYIENNQLRYGTAAAYSLLLFAYIVIVAFLFVKLLGADVIGDEESRALTAQRKKQKALAKANKTKVKLARSSVTSGEMQQ